MLQRSDWLQVMVFEDWGLIQSEAQWRRENWKGKRRDWSPGDQQGLGVSAEVAVHRLLGIPYVPQRGPDGGSDAPGFNVRATQYKGDPWLLDPEEDHDNRKEPMFVLCCPVLDEKRVIVVGVTTTLDILMSPVITHLPGREKPLTVPSHGIHWGDLEPWRGP
jgi:hypothetical protein